MADETHDLPTEPTGQEPVSTPTPEPVAVPEGYVPRERLNEVSEETRRLRQTLNTLQQTMQQEQALRQQQLAGATRNPEYDQHPYTQYLTQQYAQAAAQQQQVVFQERQRTDRIEARLELDETYGPGTFKKLSEDLETEHQQYLQRGVWMDRKELGEVLARKQGLRPLAERQDEDATRTRKRAAASAQVETGAPVTRAKPAGEKSLKAMTTDELEAQMRVQYPHGF